MPWEPEPPCGVRGDSTAIMLKLQAGAVDAHRAVFERDLQHLHGSVAEEQLGLVAGEVEAGGVVAASPCPCRTGRGC